MLGRLPFKPGHCGGHELFCALTYRAKERAWPLRTVPCVDTLDLLDTQPVQQKLRATIGVTMC